jgi:hypothetical protein
MSCSNLCEDNFINIYEKFDTFGKKIIQSLNKTNIELSNELKQIADDMSLALIIKMKLNMQKISNQHARLEATSRILEQMLEPKEENFVQYETRYTTRGLNIYQFIILSIVFVCIGINFETIRSRRSGYTEIL